MNRTRGTVKFSALLGLALLLGASQSAVGANYPPKPGASLPPIITKIIIEVPPLANNHVVITPTAPESKVVYTLTVIKPTATSLKNLATQAAPKPVLVTPGLVMGGIKASSDVPKVLINVKTKAPAEIQTVANVPNSISLGGYTPGQKVTITAIQGNKVVVIGTFTVSSKGVLVLPSVTLTGNASVNFSLKSSSGTKSVILRPVASKSKTSTAKVKLAK